MISEQQAWLKAAARVPLLTQEEEIILGRQVQAAAGIDPQSNRPEDLTVLRRAHRARERLATANLRLVYRIAERYRRWVPESGFMDLLQAGAEGVMRAAGKFDPANGSKFSTYSAWWIRERIQSEIDKNSRTIRPPTTITPKLRRLPRIREEMTARLGRSPNVEELATELKLSPADVVNALQRSNGLVSLDQLIGDDGDRSLDRSCDTTIGDLQATPADEEEDDLPELLRQGMARLPECQRRLIEAVYLPGTPTLAEQAMAEVEAGLQLLRDFKHEPLQLPAPPTTPPAVIYVPVAQASYTRRRKRRRCPEHQFELDLAV